MYIKTVQQEVLPSTENQYSMVRICFHAVVNALQFVLC